MKPSYFISNPAEKFAFNLPTRSPMLKKLSCAQRATKSKEKKAT